MTWRGIAAARRRGGLPGSPGGDKRGRDTKVSLPLLTPQPFPRTRLPPVARLKARGPQGRLVLQGITLDRSGAGRSTNQAPCTVWPRTDMRGNPRKVNSGHNSAPKSARRPESCPRNPRFAAHLRCVSAKEGLGSQEGTGNHWCPVLFCLRRQTAALPAAEGGHSATPSEGVKSPPPAVPLYRRKVYRQQTVKKKGPMQGGGTICKMFTFEPLTQNEKTAYII